MAADKLSLYNGALRFLGKSRLASLSDDVEGRYLLDAVWDDRYLRRVLEQGQWNFATRTVRADYSPSVEPPFGFKRAFDKPTDWVRTVAVAGDEFFRSPLTAREYRDEAGFWFSDLDVIYVGFVSDTTDYGGNLAIWPETFTAWVESWMGLQIAPNVTPSQSNLEALGKKSKHLLRDARSKDAMNEGAAFPPMGSWSRARTAGSSSNRGWRR